MQQQDKISINDLSRLYNASDELYHRLAVYYGMADSNLWVLYSLYLSEHACTPMELAKTWSLPKQTVHSALKALEKNGYICMQPSPDNKKNRLVLLTEAGRQLAERVTVPVVAAERRAFACLTEEEQQQLIYLMTKHYDLLEREMEQLMRGERKDI